MNFNNPREQAITALRNSIPRHDWDTNANFVARLRDKIAAHPLASNPIIACLNQGQLSLEAIKNIHLEYRHAIVQIFTDALLMAQFQTRQLEPRLHPGSKIPPRFLLTLNILDEFGFAPGFDAANYYQGNPTQAHYPLFETVLDDLGFTIEQRQLYTPSAISQSVRQFLEDSYYSYPSLIALLAIAEEQVIIYSSPLRQATRLAGFNVDRGYYHVHGSSIDETAGAADDDHQNDLWFAVMQACTPSEHQHLNTLCLQYCDLWNDFWTTQYQLYTPFNAQTSVKANGILT